MNDAADDLCAWLEDHLEGYIDGELDAADVVGLESHLRTCPSCAARAAQARQVQAGLRALPARRCPAGVAQAAWQCVRPDRRSRRPQRGATDLRGWLLTGGQRLGLAAACTALVLLGAASYHMRAAARAAEITRARAQAEWTLAYVASVGRRAGLAVTDRVARPGAGAPRVPDRPSPKL